MGGGKIIIQGDKYIQKFYQSKDMDEMNGFISAGILQKHQNIETKNTHIEIRNNSSKWIMAFSFYNDIDFEYTTKNANGAYYTNFIKAGKKAGFEIPDTPNAKIYTPSGARPWINQEMLMKWIPCYAYDLNSAYLSVLSKQIPDVRVDLGPGLVEEGEIGFSLVKGDIQTVFEKGKPAIIRHKLITSPWEKWAKSQYGRIVGAKRQGNKEEAKRLKESVVVAIGNIKNHNPFLWKFIIDSCMSFMLSLIDENTIKLNTDCIYSTVPRTDLDIGEGLGQFKEDKNNGELMFARGVHHEWGSEKKLSGVPTPLQDTYDVETGTQIRQPDYIMNGGQICQNIITRK